MQKIWPMINSAFYNKKRLESTYLNGKVEHFPIKSRSVTLEWYDHVMLEGETIYTIAEKVFGKGLGHLWTYIADNNILRHPDSWKIGDIIKLPKVILKDSDTQ